VTISERVYLPTRAAWRSWLKRHHATKREIWLVYYKRGSGKPRVQYADAVEEALCFGWIDSTLKPLDKHSYAQRFTPRKRGSNWSTPNLIRVKKLLKAGLMTPAGAVHLPSAREARAFHQKHRRRLTAPTSAPPDFARALRANAEASTMWKTLAPGYRRLYVRWIIEAKQAETRARRVKAAVLKLQRRVKHPHAPA
jgi:uncharacterized protein YdeI (YjbR/CyaY-like superfamily)